MRLLQNFRSYISVGSPSSGHLPLFGISTVEKRFFNGLNMKFARVALLYFFLMVSPRQLTAAEPVIIPQGLRNPFLTSAEQASVSVGKTAEERLGKAEKLEMKLEAIFYSEKSPLAIINGRIVGIGSTLDDNKKITRITPQQVLLSDGGKNYYLELENVTASKPAEGVENAANGQ